MHEVQTLSRLVVPPPAGVRTVWTFGLQRRFVFFFDHGTLWPKPGLLPQTSHTLDTGLLLGLRNLQAPSKHCRTNLARVPDRTGPFPIEVEHGGFVGAG
jgi:hypothetical protein